MDIKAIIFDFDGTIVDSFKALYETFKVYFEAQGISFIGMDEFKKRFTSDWKTFIKEFGADPDIKLEKTELSKITYESLLEKSKLISGVKESIIRLKQKGFRLAVVSTSIEMVISGKLLKNGIDVELIVSGYDLGITDKVKLLEYGVKRLGIEPASCIYVGDMREDIIAGKKLGMRTIALSTGFHSYRELKELEPDAVLEDGSELVEAIMSLDG